MKHLVIYVHPDSKSFCHAIKEEFIDTLRAHGKEVVVRDLYAENFDPVLRNKELKGMVKDTDATEEIKIEQAYIKWADVITFIYPIWWSHMPAILKGYIDRVFTLNFAYKISEKNYLEGLLTDKRVILINTMGATKDDYLHKGILSAMEIIVDECIFKSLEMNVVSHHFFGGMTKSTEEYRKNVLKQIKRIATSSTNEINEIYF